MTRGCDGSSISSMTTPWKSTASSTKRSTSRRDRLGYNWAKMRAAQAAVETGSTIDPEVVQTKVEQISDEVDQFAQIKKKRTSIKKSANGIEDDLNRIRDDVVDHLNDIRSELTKEAWRARRVHYRFPGRASTISAQRPWKSRPQRTTPRSQVMRAIAMR